MALLQTVAHVSAETVKRQTWEDGKAGALRCLVSVLATQSPSGQRTVCQQSHIGLPWRADLCQVCLESCADLCAKRGVLKHSDCVTVDHAEQHSGHSTWDPARNLMSAAHKVREYWFSA